MAAANVWLAAHAGPLRGVEFVSLVGVVATSTTLSKLAQTQLSTSPGRAPYAAVSRLLSTYWPALMRAIGVPDLHWETML